MRLHADAGAADPGGAGGPGRGAERPDGTAGPDEVLQRRRGDEEPGRRCPQDLHERLPVRQDRGRRPGAAATDGAAGTHEVLQRRCRGEEPQRRPAPALHEQLPQRQHGDRRSRPPRRWRPTAAAASPPRPRPSGPAAATRWSGPIPAARSSTPPARSSTARPRMAGTCAGPRRRRRGTSWPAGRASGPAPPGLWVGCGGAVAPALGCAPMPCDCAPLIAAPEPRLPSGRRRAGVSEAPAGVGLCRLGCGAAVPAGMPRGLRLRAHIAAPAPVLPSGLVCCARARRWPAGARQAPAP